MALAIVLLGFSLITLLGEGFDATAQGVVLSVLLTAPLTEYSLTEERGPGRFTARIDLADAMLRQTRESQLIGKVGHVITTASNPSLISMMLREARKK